MSLWRNFFGPPCIAVRTETAGERSCRHLRGIYKTNKNSFPMVYDICVDFPPFHFWTKLYSGREQRTSATDGSNLSRAIAFVVVIRFL